MIGQTKRIIELNNLALNSFRENRIKIIAFTSGKGGTGKTFLSLNIAYHLANRNKKILYVDLDPNLSNSNIMLNYIPDSTLYDFFIQNKLLKDVITRYSDNLHFIFGNSGKVDFPQLGRKHIKFLFEQIRAIDHHYDIVILDTGSGANEEVIEIVSNSDSAIIVTNPEPTAVMDAYVIIKLLNKNNFRRDKFIIVNRCNNPADGSNTFNNLKTAADTFLNDKNLRLLGTIDYNNVVSQSISEQVLLTKKNPRNPVSNQIFQTSSKLLEYVHMANIVQAVE